MTEQRDMAALAKGGRTNIAGFVLRLAARIPFLFIAGRLYGPDAVGRFALAVVVVELFALIATLGLKRGLAQALASAARPHVHVVFDALAVALATALIASALLFAFPGVMYPEGHLAGLDRWLSWIIFASAWSDVSLAALAYRLNVQATVTARAIIEPWTISIAAASLYFVDRRDGLVLAYMLSMLAAMTASIVPLIRSYGWPRGWAPQPGELWTLARRNAPLAGADAIEWGTRNVDRFILGLFFAPKFVGIYYMAQQVASIPQKLKTSFDPVLGPVITDSLQRDDRAAIANQVRQVAFWIIAAQACLALMGSIPGEGVMGTVGRDFVSGTAALAFLLIAEVFASQGAVCESALVYIARHVNLAVSAGMLVFQILLSLALIFAMRALGWPQNYQAAGPAVALMLSVAVTSTIKSVLLGRRLRARVWTWRWGFLWAVLAAIGVGELIILLPHRLEWLELSAGEPIIAGTYLLVIWRAAFTPADRALFAKLPKTSVEPALPNEGGAIS
jgi:O-antigen/teichoic acid export membrane protein